MQDRPVQDWVDWHLAYDDPSSALSARLARVRAHLSAAVNRAPPGQVKLISLCAGEGRDVLGVLPGHDRRDDVSAVLVECDPRNAATARCSAAAAGLSQVDVRETDASLVANFADALPAHVLLLCGIFGNVSDADIERTVGAAAALCAPGGTVIWTRHRRPPDLTSSIRAWFETNGFTELAFDALDVGPLVAVGVHQLLRARQAKLPAGQLFTFRPRGL